MPKKQPKRKRLWLNDGSCIRLRPTYRDHVWSYDFVADRTADGRPIRMLTIVDEFTRECLAIDVAKRLTSEDVLERLSDLFVHRGVACLGNPDPADMKVYCPEGKETFDDDETTEEAPS